MARALCATRPAEWWDVGDEGNRLALMLCGVCPALDACRQTAHRYEHGVIRAGVAHGPRGQVLPLCANPWCGYPNNRNDGGHGRNPLCHRCAVPIIRSWKSYWAVHGIERRRR